MRTRRIRAGKTHAAFARSIAVLACTIAMPGSMLAQSPVGLPLMPSPAMSLDDVTIVDPRSGALQEHMTIDLAGGKIVRIVPTASVPVRTGVRVNAAGKFVVPGFNDMHSHALGPVDPSGQLALLLADGITGFRQMSSSTQLLAQRRAGLLPLNANTPNLLTMSTEVLSPFNAGTPNAAAITIAADKALGAEFIKVGVVTPDVFYAVLAQGRASGMPVVGHLQNGVDAERAAREGFRSIEHLGPGEAIWIACSRDKDALLVESAAHPPLPELDIPVPIPGSDLLTSTVLKQRLINPAAYASEGDVQRLQRAYDSYDDARCRQLVSEFVTYSTWHTPTLVRLRTQYLADDVAYQSDPFLAYMPAENIKAWQDVVTTFKALPADTLATYRQAYPRLLALTRMLADAGVPMITGTDSGDLQLPGMTLHQEFDELAAAGLSPLKILQMTTINAALALGRTDHMGLVATGFDADLVLLDGNPATDSQNLKRIAGVARSGYYHSAEDLAALKARVAAGHGYLR